MAASLLTFFQRTPNKIKRDFAYSNFSQFIFLENENDKTRRHCLAVISGLTRHVRLTDDYRGFYVFENGLLIKAFSATTN